MNAHVKKLLILSSLLLALTLTSCDAFRKVAGKPTSSEIEAKRLQIEADLKAAHLARLDSLRRMEQALADSVAILDSIKLSGGTILNPSAIGGGLSAKADYRYYIIIGAFSNPANAGTLLAKAQAAGYEGQILVFKNGFNAVGVSPEDHISDAYAALCKVKAEAFCPQDAWILINE